MRVRTLSAGLGAGLAILALLAGCGRGVDATGASASEARQLNEAAAVLDANSIDINAVSPADKE